MDVRLEILQQINIDMSGFGFFFKKWLPNFKSVFRILEMVFFLVALAAETVLIEEDTQEINASF